MRFKSLGTVPFHFIPTRQINRPPTIRNTPIPFGYFSGTALFFISFLTLFQKKKKNPTVASLSKLKKLSQEARINQEVKKIQQRELSSSDYMDTNLVGLDAVKLASNIIKKKGTKKKWKSHKGVWRDENRKIAKSHVY